MWKFIIKINYWLVTSFLQITRNSEILSLAKPYCLNELSKRRVRLTQMRTIVWAGIVIYWHWIVTRIILPPPSHVLPHSSLPLPSDKRASFFFQQVALFFLMFPLLQSHFPVTYCRRTDRYCRFILYGCWIGIWCTLTGLDGDTQILKFITLKNSE